MGIKYEERPYDENRGTCAHCIKDVGIRNWLGLPYEHKIKGGDSQCPGAGFLPLEASPEGALAALDSGELSDDRAIAIEMKLDGLWPEVYAAFCARSESPSPQGGVDPSGDPRRSSWPPPEAGVDTLSAEDVAIPERAPVERRPPSPIEMKDAESAVLIAARVPSAYWDAAVELARDYGGDVCAVLDVRNAQPHIFAVYVDTGIDGKVAGVVANLNWESPKREAEPSRYAEVDVLWFPYEAFFPAIVADGIRFHDDLVRAAPGYTAQP